MAEPMWRRWARFFGPNVEHDVADEVEFHFAMRVEEFMAQGMTRTQAETAARHRFGDLDATRANLHRIGELQQTRRSWRDRWDASTQDLRYSLRSLRRSPGYSGVAVLTLALGIGANTAVFTLVNGVVLRPLPYGDTDRLFNLFEADSAGNFRLPSYPNFLDWDAQQPGLFEHLAYVRGDGVWLNEADGPVRSLAGYVTPSFFAVLGQGPLMGRVLTAEDATGSDSRVAVVSLPFWRQHLGADPKVIGKTFSLADGPVTVVGVMPAGYAYPDWAEFWMPLTAMPVRLKAFLQERSFHADGRLIGRLRTGITPTEATARLNVVGARLAAAFPAENRAWPRVNLYPVTKEVLGDTGSQLFLFLGAVAFVLLIGCANLAHLTLARASGRRREFAVRAALGAARSRIVRLLLVESALISALGGGLGLLVAIGGIALMKRQATDILPRLELVSLDGRVLAFAALVSALTSLLFGLVPALRASGLTSPDLLSTRAGGSGLARSRMRNMLVVVEMALALMLLVGASLLLRSFWQAERVAPGFNLDGLLYYQVAEVADERGNDPARLLALYPRLLDAGRAVPGVRGVTLAKNIPIMGGGLTTRLGIEGREDDPEHERQAFFETIAPNFFQVMEIPVIEGHGFTEADLPLGGGKFVVNASLAHRYWPGQRAVGKRITIRKAVQQRPDFGEPITGEIIGVVGDTRQFGLETDIQDTVYLPYTWNPGGVFLVVRAPTAGTLTATLQRALLAVDPKLIFKGKGAGFQSFTDLLSQDRAPRRFTTTLMLGFAAAGLLLAIIGLFGVVAYLVAQRTQEIGVRMALGASPGAVLSMVLRQGLVLTATGIAIGVVAALFLVKLLGTLLYGVAPTDAVSFVAAAGALAIIALVATWVPARRAAAIQPIETLRAD